MSHTPLETAIALSLYKYNRNAFERANRLFDRLSDFEKEEMSFESLMQKIESPYWATELPLQYAFFYTVDALSIYGKEAKARASGYPQG